MQYRLEDELDEDEDEETRDMTRFDLISSLCSSRDETTRLLGKLTVTEKQNKDLGAQMKLSSDRIESFQKRAKDAEMAIVRLADQIIRKNTELRIVEKKMESLQV